MRIMDRKFFLYASWRANSGPANVHKSWVINSDPNMRYIKSANTYMARLEGIIKFIFSSTILYYCGMSRWERMIVKLLNKRVIYIKHGDLKYENEVNSLSFSQQTLDADYDTMQLAAKIVCVSEKYSCWVRQQYPEFATKIDYINNGIIIDRRPKVQKTPFTIAVSGGNRNIKNNRTVCLATKILIEQGYNCKVRVYGRFYDNNENLDFPFVQCMGHMNKQVYYASLDEVQLFVVDSVMEPFGLVVADAINCNCSLLMSDMVGAASIMKTTDKDIVYNPRDVDEVAKKMLHLFLHSNIDRLYDSIDIETVSEKQAYLNLKKIVNECS